MAQTDKPLLILVDGSSYLYRAFHALPPLTTSRGEPTGAMYGVLNMLRKLLEEHRPDYVAVVFDAPGKTFRDELFEAYKAHRPPMPDDLRPQVQPLKDMVTALGIPLLQVQGVEADDVIGTLAQRGRREGMRVLISTTDKDMAQLVNDEITVLNTMSNRVYDAAGVEAKFGVPPRCIIDYLALVGDSSDNIPGVPKWGEKTAAKWLQEYGSLDAIVANAEAIKGKVGESLREHLETLALSRKLATIHCDCELDQEPADLVQGEPDRERLAEFYQRFEFTGWLGKLREEQHQQVEEAVPAQDFHADYDTVMDAESLQRWLERLRAAELIAFDLETRSLDYMAGEICGFSFAVAPGEAAYVPVAHNCLGAPVQLPLEQVLEALQPILEDPERPKVGQNLKYDMSVLARNGVALRGIEHDTMLESYVLDSTATRHDMDSLALKFLGHRTIHFEDVAGKGAKQVSFDQVAVEDAARYAAEDADVTLRLHQAIYPRLAEIPSLERLYRDIEVPLIGVLSRIERNGVLVDAALLRSQSKELGERILDIEQQAYKEAGGPFNLGSPKQIQEILFDRQGLPVIAKTPKGQPSTAENVLAELAEDFPLPRLILEHRGMSKLRSTYTEKLPKLVNPDTGRVHTSYHQAAVATGRLSSSDPNLQNIPVRTHEGRRIRQAFIAAPGHKLLAADYSQVELRIMAHLSGDERLVEAFASGEDVHRATAAEIFGAAVDAVSQDQRRVAKTINFGLIYGMSAFGLAKQLNIGRQQAQQYVNRYFERYTGVRAFMERTREQAREQGYVETVYGRRLYLPEINSRNGQRRQYAERTAINAPMQGTAADIIKRAMISLDQWLTETHPQVRMVLQVHDELVFEVPEAELEAVCEGVRARMCAAGDLTVPLEVELGVGNNWDEAH